jgi:hypothetical protein
MVIHQIGGLTGPQIAPIPRHLVSGYEFILAPASEHHTINLLIGESVPTEASPRKAQRNAVRVEG